MKEIWKDINGFDGLYQISNFGNVKSINFNNTKTEKLMKLSIDRYGYNYVSFTKFNKKLKVHRLVALTFIPNPENKITVNHIDENKLNNHVDNLEWYTVSEQNKHSKGKKILINGIMYNSLREAENITKISRKKLSKTLSQS
jgi:hypothetical protein